MPTIRLRWRALPATAAWLDTKAVDMGPYFRRRGSGVRDGKPLEPVELQRELVTSRSCTLADRRREHSRRWPRTPPRDTRGPMMQEIGGSKDGRFYTDANGQSIHIRLASGTPADHMIEITIREQVFAPTRPRGQLHPFKGHHVRACRQWLPAAAARGDGGYERVGGAGYRGQHIRVGECNRP